MSLKNSNQITKTITINSTDFFILEKVFFDYYKNNPEDTKTLKTIQSIINQSID